MKKLTKYGLILLLLPPIITGILGMFQGYFTAQLPPHPSQETQRPSPTPSNSHEPQHVEEQVDAGIPAKSTKIYRPKGKLIEVDLLVDLDEDVDQFFIDGKIAGFSRETENFKTVKVTPGVHTFKIITENLVYQSTANVENSGEKIYLKKRFRKE